MPPHIEAHRLKACGIKERCEYMSNIQLKNPKDERDFQELVNEVRQLNLNMCEWELIEYFDSENDVERAFIIQENYRTINPKILAVLAVHPEESEMIRQAAQAALDALKVQERGDDLINQDNILEHEEVELSISLH